MEHEIPFGNSNWENGPTFLDFPLFLGIFQWDESTKRVSFTAEPEIPEILTKWKAPSMQQGVQRNATCNIQQCWELLAENVASVVEDSNVIIVPKCNKGPKCNKFQP